MNITNKIKRVFASAVIALSLAVSGFTTASAQSGSANSPYTNTIFPAITMTGTGTSGPIQFAPTPSGVSGAYSVGNISVTGVGLTTVTFSVLGSTDGGSTYTALPVSSITSPGTTSTSTTVTASGVYQVNVSGVTHIEIQTTGTFTATSVKFVVTTSPTGLIARVGQGGGGGGNVYRPTGQYVEYDLSQTSGTTVPDISGNGLNGTVQYSGTAPILTSAGLVFNRAYTQRVSLPSGVYSLGTVKAMAVCYDATVNLTDSTGGTEPVLGSDDPNGQYFYVGDVNLYNTRIGVGWRGVPTETAQQTYGSQCVGWTGGTTAGSPDTININGSPAAVYLPGGGSNPSSARAAMSCTNQTVWTAATTLGSNVLTGVSVTSGGPLMVGQVVYSGATPAGATIASISGSTVTLGAGQNATGTYGVVNFTSTTCGFQNPPLANAGNPYLAYTNQEQNTISAAYPSYFSGSIYHVIYYYTAPTQAQMSATLTSLAASLQAKGVEFNATNTSVTTSLVVSGDSRSAEHIPSNGSLGAWVPAITGPPLNVGGLQKINLAISGDVCESQAAAVSGAGGPWASPFSSSNVAIWFCAVNSYGDPPPTGGGLGDTPQIVLNLFDQWNTVMRSHGFKTFIVTEPYHSGSSTSGPNSGSTYDSIRQAINTGYYARASQVAGVIDFGSNAWAGTAAAYTPRTVVSITNCSVTNSVATITGTNTFVAGDIIGVTGLTNCPNVNTLQATVLSAGLSGSQFEINTTSGNFSSTADSGYAATYTIDGIHPSITGNGVIVSLANTATAQAFSPTQPIYTPTSLSTNRTGPATFTALATGLTSVACVSTTCNSQSGLLYIVGTSAADQGFTINWPATVTPPISCVFSVAASNSANNSWALGTVTTTSAVFAPFAGVTTFTYLNYHCDY